MAIKRVASGTSTLPPVLNQGEYAECIASFERLGHEYLLTRAYIKNEKTGTYELREDLDEQDVTDLWDHYAAINKTKWRSLATVNIVAQYIYFHRRRFDRIGNEKDDYIKAEYLVNLVTYLNDKHSHIIRLRQGEEFEEIVDEVNNIFDDAYFCKINNPLLSDEECFFCAERKYCEDKEIEFLEFKLRNKDAAERAHWEAEIRVLAKQQYEWRIQHQEQGDDRSDWFAAVEQYPKWRMTRRIATISWNLAADKHKHQDFYWARACAVVNRLEQLHIPYIGANPYDEPIHAVILEVCSEA